MERFTGKVAVVTGSSTGIGRAITKELVKRGLIVAGLARNVKNQQDLSTEILKSPEIYTGKFHPIKCDLMQEKDIKDAFDHVKTNFGQITILINNAAFLGPHKELTEVASDTWQQIFDTNAKGSWLCLKEALQSMKDLAIVGHIININSVASLPDFRTEFFSIYAASKDTLRTISRVARREILKKNQNIKVTDISPGGTDTPMVAGVKSSFTLQPEDFLSAEDVARACISVLDTPPDVLELSTEILESPEIYTGKFHPIKCNLMQEKDINDAFDQIKTNIGQITILINNAAFLGPYKGLTEIDSDTWQQIFDTNAKGSWLCLKEALQSMKDLAIVGHIININSIASLHDFHAEYFSIYAASKDALRTISRGARREILEKNQNIKVTDISPGGTDTPMAAGVKSTFTLHQEDLLPAEDIARACISVLDTPPDVLITELTIIPRRTSLQ